MNRYPGSRSFAAAVVVLLAFAGCAGLTKPWLVPEVTLAGAQPAVIGRDRQSFILNLRVKNPNDRTLPIKAMTYRLSVEGEEIADGASELERQIPAFGQETVDVEVNISLLRLLPQLPLLALKRENLHWEIDGTLMIAGGFVTLPYRYSGEISPGSLMGVTGR